MRRISLWLLVTVCLLLLVFSYHTSTGPEDGSAAGATGSGGPVAAGPPGDGSASPSGTGLSGARGSTQAGRTGVAFDGSVAHTRRGPVQVRITVQGGRITDVTALQVPDGGRLDVQINDYAVPILRQEALDAQSAQIDTVSGATVTSEGYRESLQAALDAAQLR